MARRDDDKIPNADFRRTQREENLSARLGRCHQKAPKPEKHVRQENLFVPKAWAACAVGDETLTVRNMAGVMWAGSVRQVFNDTPRNAYGLVAPAGELEFCPRTRSRHVDAYPVTRTGDPSE